MPGRSVSLSLLAVLAWAAGGTVARAEELPKSSHALLVGVREYDSSKFDPLKYTENDVEELAKVLRGKAAFTGVRLLTTARGKKNAPDAPTRKNISAALQALLKGRTRNDTVLIALSGHGLQQKTSQGDESFFCPADAQLNDVKTLLGLRTLFGELKDCGAAVKLILIDACRNDPAAGRSVDVDNVPRPSQGMAALFSCKSGERAFETAKLGKGHGVFFYHVLKGLQGAAKNRRGEITWTGLSDYVTEKVSEEVPRIIGGGAQQTPQEIKDLTGKAPVLVRVPATEGEGDRLFRLAREHHLGQTRKMDLHEAARLYRAAADAGHPLAAGFLAVFTLHGSGVKQDQQAAERMGQKAAPRVRQAARDGDAAARVLLGDMHLSGLGVARDDAEALRLFRLAAEQGDASAQNNLAWMTEKGRGTRKDLEQAVAWYGKAAEQGLAVAQCNLGWLHVHGQGVEKDLQAALGWYSRAAEKDCAEAQHRLASMYQHGEGTGRDLEKAAAWHRRAAEQDHAGAQVDLARMYENGWGVNRSLPAAAGWLRKAAERGRADAQHRLAGLYAAGQGVKKSEPEAARWYARAAGQNHPGAMLELGRMYAQGKGVATDEKEAARWYRRAAGQNNPAAKFHLAVACAEGKGVEKNEKEAVRWFREAAEQGHAAAANWLGAMYEGGKGVQASRAEARKWYRKAAAQGVAEARVRLKKMP